jgi:hypothetical protein
MMTPTRRQVFWARRRPWALWFLVVPVLVALVVLSEHGISARMLARWPDCVWAVATAVIGWILGVLLAMITGWVVVGSAQHAQVIANGGPFLVGDTVQIVTGRFAGRVGRVYATGAYEMVYVDVGTEAKERHEDVFAQVSLLRVDVPGDSRA